MLKKFLLIFIFALSTFAYSKTYTLVFANIHTMANAHHFIDKYLQDEDDVSIVRFKNRYRVVYKKFVSIKEARKYINYLPYRLRQIKPFVTRYIPENLILDVNTNKRYKVASSMEKSIKRQIKPKKTQALQEKPKRIKPSYTESKKKETQGIVLKRFVISKSDNIDEKIDEKIDKIKPIKKVENISNHFSKKLEKETKIIKSKKRFIFPKKYLRDVHTRYNEVVFR